MFPETPRVIYDKNPLFEVVCQLRFPTILRIDSEAPVAFQEGLREHYPIFREKLAADMPKELPPQIARLVASELSGVAGYDFVSGDDQWKVGLTKEFVALVTTHYERWETFRDRLERVISVLRDIYKPAFFTRVGLRYQNAIRKSVVADAKQGVEWASILKPHVLGVLGSQDVSHNIRESRSTTLIELPQVGQVRLRTGTGRRVADGEEVFVIDADFFYDDRTEISDVISRLALFNRESGHLFRWCITDSLNEAMGPRPA